MCVCVCVNVASFSAPIEMVVLFLFLGGFDSSGRTVKLVVVSLRWPRNRGSPTDVVEQPIAIMSLEKILAVLSLFHKGDCQ